MSILGKVTWFDGPLGYGFIEAEGIENVYVHFSAIQARGYKALFDGQRVTFDLVQGLKGPQAENVNPIQRLGF